jgi:hypothetical protein
MLVVTSQPELKDIQVSKQSATLEALRKVGRHHNNFSSLYASYFPSQGGKSRKEVYDIL